MADPVYLARFAEVGTLSNPLGELKILRNPKEEWNGSVNEGEWNINEGEYQLTGIIHYRD